MSLTNAQKAQRLEEMANVCIGSDADLLRESAAMWRERGGISWTSEGHGMVLTSAIYRNRLMAIVGRSGRTFFWTVSKVAAREHEEFGTADTLEAAQAAAVAWLDEQEGK
jgi:hypothetical protein